MLSLLVYSGKGGVGKTTITYGLFKSYQALGYKVAVLDMDLNTPSFHHLESSEFIISSSKNLGLFVDTAQVSLFIKTAKDRINKIKPDILLIDSPPSLTHIHYSIIEKIGVSGVVLVTQPTLLSISDVERTVPFFEQKGITVTGIVENMTPANSLDDEDEDEVTYRYNKLASITDVFTHDSIMVYKLHRDEFSDLAQKLYNLDLNQVSQENRKRQLFDETITFDAVKDMYDLVESDYGEIYINQARKKNRCTLSDLKFVNVATWGELREVIMSMQVFTGANFKDVVSEATPERVERLIKAFETDDKAMFMITRCVDVVTKTVIGEIGYCTLLMQDTHHGIPCVQYQTSKGPITLFPHEVLPVTQETIDTCIAEGSTYVDDGSRLVPNLETAQVLAEMDTGVDITNTWNEVMGKTSHAY